jgi:cyclophilin family peptidyl-prolyl cis-trans isomerase
MPHVKLTTSLGDIVLQLDEDKAPLSTANFLAYVDKGHYDQTIFHRVIPTFMIQGGGFTADMKQKSTMDPIQNEWNNGLKNTRGTVACARTSDPHSATAQFFINVKDNGFLSEARDGTAGYAVFGRVISGMDIVDKIKDVPTGNHRGMSDVPKTPVSIVKASRMTDDEVAAIKK